MSNRRRTNRRSAKERRGILRVARAERRLAANVVEEEDWYLDAPDVKLPRIFGVVILLHILAVGGIFAFKMVDKASSHEVVITKARQNLESVVQEQKAIAAQVPTTGATDVAQARQPIPAPLRPDPSKRQHQILVGEKLTEIAAMYNVSPQALRAKNGIISDNGLYPGRFLDIPEVNEVVAPPAAQEATAVAAAAPAAAAVPVAKPVEKVAEKVVEKPAAKTDPSKAQSYVVKQGDTPWGIARQFNVPFNKLMSANGITNPQTLKIGQKLNIPAGN